MLIITVHVNAPSWQAIGIKEQIAQDLERYGDTRVVSVEARGPEQMTIGGEAYHAEKRMSRMWR